MSQPNPYAPPGAAVQDPPARPGSAVKAVVLGLLVDVGGTTLGSMIIGAIYGVALAASGAGMEELEAASRGWAQVSWLFWLTSAMGLGFSVLGGYTCARVARRDELRLGGVLAALSAGLGYLLAGDAYELGTFLSLTLAGIGAVVVGARWGYARNRSTK